MFSIITPGFSVTWPFKKSFEYADLLLNKYFLLLSMVELIHIFVETMIYLVFHDPWCHFWSIMTVGAGTKMKMKEVTVPEHV